MSGSLASLLESSIQNSYLLAILFSFLGGLLASLSPCVYPLLPVVATYVSSRSIEEQTKLKAFTLSLIYVLGVALVYSLLGMLAALTGRLFGQISTNPWVFFIVANLIILFSLNLLDVIAFPQLSFNKSSQNKERKGYLGALLLGIASGFVASPCTAPVLGVVLTYVATTQDVVLGGSMLFSFSMGMGILLIVVGTFAGLLTTLPKPGEWMNKIKLVLGLLMLGLGEYFLIKTGQLMF